ncbi:hypothetical protein [Endozoicomonas sp. YOMI1]|uniref:hypothetical protein n=1 Tax=Endozoicomonas sp. YOMI1 TaxID=2828739 RepID=UPI0021475951|nr:hypothetical protein [Endozoicomonas sp. YOMI1]
MQSVRASSYFPLNTPANTDSPRQHLKTANISECPGSNNTPIHHRQTRPVQLGKTSDCSDSTRNDLESSDRETSSLKKKEAGKPATTDTDTSSGDSTSTLDSWHSETESISPRNSSVDENTTDAPTAQVALTVGEQDSDKEPLEAESAYWQSTAQYILSGIKKLANAVLPTPSEALKHINLDMPWFSEEHEDDQYIELPIDVDAIDSDLNSRGQPVGRAQSKSVQPEKDCSSTPYESEENDDKTAGASEREHSLKKHSADHRKHHTPPELQEIYQQSLPIVKLSPHTYGNPSSISIDGKDGQPELLIALYPHGILQALLILFPETAVEILKSRLEKLCSTSMDTFEQLHKSRMQNRAGFRDTLATNLATLRENLNDLESDRHNVRFQLAMLKNLRKFEHQYNVYSLESKMDADFLVQKGRISSKQLATALDNVEGNQLKDPKLLNPTTWLRNFGHQCKEREFILRGAMWSLAKYHLEKSAQSVLNELMQHPPVRVPVVTTDTCKRTTVNHYIREQPEIVMKVLSYLVCLNVKRYRCIKSIKAAKLVLTTGQQAHTAESVQALLSRLTRQNLIPEIATQLENEIGWLHAKRLNRELESPQATASLTDLMNQRQHILNLRLLNPEKNKPPLKGETDRLACIERKVAARLIHHFLATQSSPNQSGLFPHWFFLKPPAYDRIRTILSQSSNTPEKSFYLATLQFIDAMSRSEQDDSYDSCLQWMQCYYDMTYAEQRLLIHLIDQDGPDGLLPGEHFEQNIDALWQLARSRKSMGLRPLNPDSYAYYLSYLNFVREEEESIEDSIAELYRKRYLKLLDYDPYQEFKTLFGDVFNWGSQASRNICQKADELMQGLKASGLSNALGFLYKEGKGLISSLFSSDNPIHSLITDTLGTMLKVAQQNPKFFRVMWGDFALLMPQLKSLLGQETSVTGLLESIEICMRGHALASLFSGDQPQPLDVNPLENPQMATVIKRFQLLRDMITAFHTGLPVIEIFLSNSLDTLINKAKKVAQNVLSTYLARHCLSHMKPAIFRLLNNLRCARDLMPSLTLGLTSDCLAAMAPETTVRLAHHIGRRTSVVGSVLGFLLDPLVMRFDKYQEKINNAKANPSSIAARNELASERKKVAGILGLSSLLATAAIVLVNTFQIVLLLSSPWLTTACIGIITFFGSSCFVARRYNELDEVWTSLSETISEQMKRTFAKDSPKAIEARQRAHQISKDTLTKMSEAREQALSGWQDWQQNQILRELSKYWHQLHYKEEMLQRIKSTVREKCQSDVQRDAQHILNFVQAKALVENAIRDPDHLSANPDHLADFNQQLARLYFPPLDAALFPYQLINLEQEINAFLEHACGTDCPGENIRAIMDTVENYHIDLHKGEYLLKLLHMRHLQSLSLGADRATDQPFHQALLHCSETTEAPMAHLPDQLTATAIMAKTQQKCEQQQLKKEELIREARMKMVTRRALHDCLKGETKYSASNIPDFSKDPLFKTHLELQIKELEKASLPWSIDHTLPSARTSDSDQPPPGCTYKALEAGSAFAGK